MPYARTTRLRFDRANGLAFTNTFQFCPWMLDKQFEDVILINLAQVHPAMPAGCYSLRHRVRLCRPVTDSSAPFDFPCR